MAAPRACVIDGMKFMWDGRNYESAEEAKKVKEEYEKERFEARMLEVDGKYQLFTRRVVTEIVLDGAPPP